MFRGDSNEVSFSKSVGGYALTDWVVYLSQAVGQGRREDRNLHKKATKAVEIRGKDFFVAVGLSLGRSPCDLAVKMYSLMPVCGRDEAPACP